MQEGTSGAFARQRGVTLVEVLIVVAIMTLVSAAVAVAAIKYWQDSKVKTAQTSARSLRETVKGRWALHESETCPTVVELIADGFLDEASPREDPWGTPWRIECVGTAVTVSSDGPDKQRGTTDDIRVPPTTTGAQH